ncbi:MAG TPA: serine hydroxymethyltransferase [Candidatus Kapabacteria bacterium]|nr:serine hydroxymethyltransferase [Candidatus Kapabacteria bacterium]
MPTLTTTTTPNPIPLLADWMQARYGGLITLYDRFLRPAHSTIHELVMYEVERQTSFINLIASESLPSPATFAAFTALTHSQTAEGLLGRRTIPMGAPIDALEKLAADTASTLFGLPHANVQPHTATQANQAVMIATLHPGDRILTMDIHRGGHLSHGFGASLVAQLYEVHTFGWDDDERIDYAGLASTIEHLRPRLVISGTSAYPRAIDFEAISSWANQFGALHLADISHVAGLICAALHPGVSGADFATLSLHKTMCGPRGGVVLSHPDHGEELDTAVFPGVQSALMGNLLVAKSVALSEATAPAFAALQQRIVANAHALASALVEQGISVVTSGTDTHLVLIRAPEGTEGDAVQDLLHRGGILCNRHPIPGNTGNTEPRYGNRFGTTWISQVGFGPEDAGELGSLIGQIITGKKSPAAAVAACAQLVSRVLG